MPLAAGLKLPSGIVHDGQSTVYFSDTENHVIRKLDVGSGNVSIFAGTLGVPCSADLSGTGASFNKPQGLDIDGGYLYVVDSANELVRRVRISDQAVETLAGTLGVAGADNGVGAAAKFSFMTSAGFYSNNLVVDHAGALYVADFGNVAARKLDVASKTVSTLALVPAALGISYDGFHTLYVGGLLSISAVDLPSGTVRTVAGGTRTGVQFGPLPASLNWVTNLKVLSSGDLLLTDSLESALLKITTQ